MFKPVHRYIPYWISSKLENRSCQKCKQKIKKENIIAIGVRQTGENTTLYIEHKCPRCDYREMTNFNGRNTVEELCYTLLESIKIQRDIEKSKEIEKHSKTSSISDAEINEALKFIRSTKTHDEFMKYIKADKFKRLDNE